MVRKGHCLKLEMLLAFFFSLFPGPASFLAGNWVHVIGQRAVMETPAVVSGTTFRALDSKIKSEF